MRKKNPTSGCNTGCSVEFTSIPIEGQERECVDKASWFTRHCKGKMYKAGSFVYNDCGFFATDEATDMDVMDTKSPWVAFSLTWIFNKLFKGYHEDDWSCDMVYDEDECVPYCGKYRVSLRADNVVEPNVSDKLPENERWWSAPMKLCELLASVNENITHATIDKVVNEDGSVTITYHPADGSADVIFDIPAPAPEPEPDVDCETKNLQYKLIGEAPSFRVIKGTASEVVSGSPLSLESIVLKKSDCCTDHDGIMINIESNAKIDMSDSTQEDDAWAQSHIEVKSGYSTITEVGAVTAVAKGGQRDGKSEHHVAVFPWDSNGEITLTLVVDQFEMSEMSDGYVSCKVYGIQCTCGTYAECGDEATSTCPDITECTAGANQTVNSGDTVNLSASANAGTDEIISYAWTQTSGTAVTLTGADTATPSFTADAAGDVVLSVTMQNSCGNSTTCSTTVTVAAVAEVIVTTYAQNGAMFSPGRSCGDLSLVPLVDGADQNLCESLDLCFLKIVVSGDTVTASNVTFSKVSGVDIMAVGSISPYTTAVAPFGFGAQSESFTSAPVASGFQLSEYRAVGTTDNGTAFDITRIVALVGDV